MIKIYKKYRTVVFAFYNRNASAFATNIKPENEYAKNRIVLNPTPKTRARNGGFSGRKRKVLTVGVKKTAKNS